MPSISTVPRCRCSKTSVSPIEPGEFVALLGPSGCGKSTLLRLVAGLEAPRAGMLREDDAASRARIPSRVVVFQDPTLFPWRIGLGQCRARPGGAGHPEEPAAARRRGARSRRPVGVPQRLSASAVGRHGAARGAGARAGQRSENPHPRRAARQARLADAHHHAGRARLALATQGLYHAARHPRRRRGAVSRQPRHRAQRPARRASRPISWWTGHIRAIAAIPISRTCANKFSACLDWTPHGDDASSQPAAREPQRQDRARPCRTCGAAGRRRLRSGRLSTTAMAVFRSRISTTCRRPDCWP